MEKNSDELSYDEYLNSCNKTEPKEIKEIINVPKEFLKIPEIKYKPLPQEPKKIIKKTKTNKGFALVFIFLTIISLGTSAYVAYDNHYLKSQLNNPEIIYNGDWDCFTERCTEYMTLNEWSRDNCNDELTECLINYQGQDVTLPFEQINLPSDHELLCKEFKCSTEIPIRRYLDE